VRPSKNEWSHISPPPILLHSVDRENCTFTLPCHEVSCHLIEWANVFPGGSRLQHHLLDLASEFIPLCPMSVVCEHKAVQNRLSLGNPTLKAALSPPILQSFFLDFNYMYSSSSICLEDGNTGLFEIIIWVLTTCHTQYTWDRSICFFLFNRTTLQVFVTYLTGALYVHPLW